VAGCERLRLSVGILLVCLFKKGISDLILETLMERKLFPENSYRGALIWSHKKLVDTSRSTVIFGKYSCLQHRPHLNIESFMVR
jgi:hypothetical protein